MSILFDYILGRLRKKDTGGGGGGTGNVSGYMIFTGPMTGGQLYTFTHGLNTRYVQLQIFYNDNNAEAEILRPTPTNAMNKVDVKTVNDIEDGLYISVLGHD